MSDLAIATRSTHAAGELQRPGLLEPHKSDQADQIVDRRGERSTPAYSAGRRTFWRTERHGG